MKQFGKIKTLTFIALFGCLLVQAQDSTVKTDTTVKRPSKITCACQCHDGISGFFHCWVDCCKWPNEPRILPKNKKRKP